MWVLAVTRAPRMKAQLQAPLESAGAWAWPESVAE